MTWEFSAHQPFDVVSLEARGAGVDWNLLKCRLLPGTVLTGKIFARSLFAIFFDAGEEFPVRMNITDFGKPNGNMAWPEDYPALESEISGVFNGFDDNHYQLVVIRLGLTLHSD